MREHHVLTFSIINFYEILSGLKHKSPPGKVDGFLQFSGSCRILPLTRESVEASSEIYAELRRGGDPIDDIDILIAGIALTNGLSVATHNEKHFGRIRGLTVVDWSVAGLS